MAILMGVILVRLAKVRFCVSAFFALRFGSLYSLDAAAFIIWSTRSLINFCGLYYIVSVGLFLGVEI